MRILATIGILDDHVQADDCSAVGGALRDETLQLRIECVHLFDSIAELLSMGFAKLSGIYGTLVPP